MSVSPESLRELLEAIREACHPRAWSRGVVLARDEAVEGKEETDDELVLAVHAAERPVALTVVLYPETLEWDCDCDAKADACAHAAAAIIALVKARESGRAMPGRTQATAKIRYRFRRGAKLVLERLLVQPDETVSILSGEVARRAQSERMSLEPVDLSIEPLVRSGSVEVTHAEQAVKLLSELEDARDVQLEDRAVKTSRRAVMPRGRVEGDERRVVFSILPNASIEEVLTDGIVLANGVLHPIGEPGLCGTRLEKLPIRREFARAAFAELVGEVLPLYRARFDVELAAPLPALVARGRPRIDFRLELTEDAAAVTPELVYGTQLRIEDKRAIYLGGAVPERDHAEERRLVEALRTELNLITGRRVVVRGTEAQAFLQKLRSFQQGAIEEDVLPRLVPRFEVHEDHFVLDFSAEDADGRPVRADPVQVLRAFESGHELVPLLGGGWAELPRDFLAAHGDRIALLLQLRGEDGKVPTFALPALAALAAALDQPPPAGLERLAPLFFGFERLPEIELPDDLTATLRPYQQQGVDWLCFMRDAQLGALLADDMGLGKTLQALVAVRGRTLIVCPTSVLPNWEKEIRRFRPKLSVNMYHGPNRRLSSGVDITLTTYALLRIDAEALGAIDWETVILDEAQAIKNADSLTARCAFALRSQWRVTLTGTPIENRLDELWSQLHFLNPGLLHGRAEFNARFAKPIAEGDAGVAAKLRERIRPFVLRRLKRDVARDLPPRTDMVLFTELDDPERAIYESIHLATKREVVAKLAQGASMLAALEALLRLRQAACHSALVPGQSAASSSKLETLLETLTEVIDEGHKALVFSQWTSLLDLLEPSLTRANLNYLRLDGSTRDRAGVVAAFQANDGPPVLIISLKAGGTGLNLTAADHVFLLDPWWNPAVEDQAADRAHRIGQTRPVIVHRLVARSTVEERILELQARKRAVADVALGEAQAAAALTREDLLALLD